MRGAKMAGKPVFLDALARAVGRRVHRRKNEGMHAPYPPHDEAPADPLLARERHEDGLLDELHDGAEALLLGPRRRHAGLAQRPLQRRVGRAAAA